MNGEASEAALANVEMSNGMTNRDDLTTVFRFYDETYEMVSHYFVQPGKKVYLGEQENRQCRFCGRSSPDATFVNDAHAVPECLGNTTLLSYYECDSCNQLFGHGIENDFGNWSKPMRTLARVKGKKGIPTIKHQQGQPWRIEATSSMLNITSYEDNPAFRVDQVKKEVTFTLQRDAYTPIAALKALVKMGLTILPANEMVNFQQAVSWIKEKDHSKGPIPAEPVIHTFVAGPLPNNFVVLIAFRRKHDHLKVPYATFILCYANEMIQVFLPSPERDQLVTGEITVSRFPSPSELEHLSKTMSFHLDGSSVIKGEEVTATMSFETVERVESENS
jgi:hypothetical protein